jgi:hypothetical protein
MIQTVMVRKLLVLLLLAIPSLSAQTAPAIPPTPAGEVLRAWLDAFNSADATKIASFVKSTYPAESANGMLAFARQTGGFNLLSIDASEPTLIRFRVTEKNGPTNALGSFTVSTSRPPLVVTFNITAMPPGAVPEDITLDAAARARLIEAIAASLEKSYIFSETAQTMSAALRAHQQQGDYNTITTGDAFAERLTSDLREVSHDKHLSVRYAPFKQPERKEQTPSPEEKARYQQSMESENCGFDAVDILPNNIGYLKFHEFADPEVCGPTATAAMNFLAHTRALIVDLRENHGGAPDMVTYLISYLFDTPTHINDLYNREESSTHQYWTLPYVSGPRLATQPVYVLTSTGTFSGAEEFVYDLKNLKRATIIGETTGGGAHPMRGHRLDDHFTLALPIARPINPTSKTDWEGTGIKPDIPVPAADALSTAQKLASESLHRAKP